MSRFLVLLTVAAGLCLGPHLAEARAATGPGEKTVMTRLTPHALGLSAKATKREVALAALQRHHRRFELGSSRELALVDDRAGAPGLAFEQRVGGVPVLWSRIGVTLRGKTVTALHGVTIPVRNLRSLPAKRIGAAKAQEVARAQVDGPAHVSRTQLVIAAGAPGKPSARARLGYVVQVNPDAPVAGEAGEAKVDSLCVVVDAVTGAVLTTWRGTAAPTAAERGATPDAPASDRPLAHAAATTPQSTSLALIFDAQGNDAYDNGDNGIRFAWSWNVLRPVPTTGSAPPFTVFNFLYSPDYRRTWSGAYVGNDEVDNKVAVFAQQYHDWQCKQNAWCAANGLKDGAVYPYKVIANHKALTFGGAGGGSFAIDGKAYIATGSGLSADVTAHEMGHLRYEQQMGGFRSETRYAAVNEAMADIGEFLFYDGKQAVLDRGAVNPRNPFNDGDKTQYANSISNYYCGTLDGGGAHFNSTIISRAFVDFYDRTDLGTARAMYNTLLGVWMSKNTDLRGWFSAFEAALITSFGSVRAQGEAAQKLVGFDPYKPSPKLPC